VSAGAKLKEELSTEEIKKLVFENEIRKLMEKALHFLSFRPRSGREISDHLRKKFRVSDFGFRISVDQVIDTVIDRLKRLGYVNDEEFSRWWIEQRQTHNPRGARLIRSELFQKGISQEIIDQVLPEDEEGENETILNQGRFQLKHDETKTIPASIQISQPPKRTKITVSLINKNQPIHFWVEEKGD